MEWVNKKIVILAVILSLLTSLFIYSYVNRMTSTTKTKDIVKVYVAAKNIPARSMITAAELKEIEIDRQYVLPGTFINKAEIIGKRAKDSIMAGEQIHKERLADQEKMNLAYRVPEGKRAVSINVNEASNVANFLRPGDFVDVIATFEKEEVVELNRKVIYPKITKTVLQNIQILGIGQESQAVQQDDKKKETPKTVTLAVAPGDAEKIVFTTEVGVVRLALRPVGETQEVQTSGVVRPEMTGEKGAVVIPK